MIIYSANKDIFFLFPKIIPAIQSLSRVHSLQPHGLQHARLPCPSLSPRVSSNSCALSTLCCYQTISSSAVLFSFGLPSFPDQGLFQGVHCLLRWPNYWNFGFSISSSSEYSGLISFRIDWLDLLALQGNLKSLLQHHSLEALILWCSAFFIV